MTSISYVGAGTGVANGAVGTLAVPLPAGVVEDDYLLLCAQTKADQNIGAEPEASYGYTELWNVPSDDGNTGAAHSRVTVFAKYAGASEANPSISTPGNHALAQVVAFRGVGAVNASASLADAASKDLTISAPGLTTTTDEALIVAIMTAGNENGYGSEANGDLVDLTLRSAVQTTIGAGGSLAIITGEKVAAGAVGVTTATLSTNTSYDACVTLALGPATPPVPPGLHLAGLTLSGATLLTPGRPLLLSERKA